MEASNMITRFALRSVLGAALVISGCGSSAPVDQVGMDGAQLTGDDAAALGAARDANEKYQDLNVATAEGFIPISPCVSGPTGVMGIHYGSINRLFAPLNADTPAILLYEPKSDGTMKLMGFEYNVFIFQDGRPYIGDGVTPPRPESIAAAEARTLYGEHFNTPTPGHFPGMPWHVHMHVWSYLHNSNGLFDEFNPNASCTGN
jgi:hypothetical protein